VITQKKKKKQQSLLQRATKRKKRRERERKRRQTEDNTQYTERARERERERKERKRGEKGIEEVFNTTEEKTICLRALHPFILCNSNKVCLYIHSPLTYSLSHLIHINTPNKKKNDIQS